MASLIVCVDSIINIYDQFNVTLVCHAVRRDLPIPMVRSWVNRWRFWQKVKIPPFKSSNVAPQNVNASFIWRSKIGGHLSWVVCEMVCLCATLGSYEASYRQYLEQQSMDPARSTTAFTMANDEDSEVVLNLQLVPEVDTRGTPMYKVTTRVRE